MDINYHTHTIRCNHASGSEREFIEEAIAHNMPVLGFADHCPYIFFDTDYYSGHRMWPHQTEDYFTTLVKLREEYKGQIDIKIGLETEYYPKYFGRLLEFLAPYPLDYMILGQHFIGNEVPPGIYSGAETDSEQRLAIYVNQVLEALSLGCFSYLAHPDLPKFVGDAAAYRRQNLRLCEGAKKLNIPLEINLLGIREKRQYPREDFFEIAAEVGNEIILGSDAHAPDVVFDAPSRETAKTMAKKLGLKLIEDVKLLPVPHSL